MRRELYPDNWEEISKEVRERSGGQCECEGFCGLHTGRRCEEKNGQQAKWARGKITLTVAHLTHNPQDCRRECLKAMCQRCHLRYDRLYKSRKKLEKKDLLVVEKGDLTGF